ncbi:MAG TPA: CotH kinase family protein [Bacteroidia bacterium]|jgi:subtilisin-like proprotein convertase family protein
MKKIFTLALFTLPFLTGAQTFQGVGGGIQNNGQPTYFYLNVTGLPSQLDNNFGLTDVSITINHPAVQELSVNLQSPSGTTVELTDGNNCSGPNYTGTSFNSSNSTSITLGASPYTGAFKPIGYFGRFNNWQNPNGSWRLIVKDYVAFFNSGTVISWSITFGTSPSPAINFTSSNLPILFINTNNQTISSNSVQVNMGIIDNSPNRNNTNDAWNAYNGKVGIHLHGSSSRAFEKKPYAIETQDASGNAIDVPLLGMPAESDWLLIASYQDKTLMRSPLSYEFYRRMGHYAPRFRYVELVLNNEYQGVYQLMEKPKRDSLRISVKKLSATDNSAPNITGGYILKIDRTNAPGWYSQYPGNSNAGSRFYYQYDYPKDSKITSAQRSYIQAYMDSVEEAFNSPNFADPQTGYPNFIGVGTFVDFFILNEFSKNIDAYRLSTYLYKDRDGHGSKLHIGPVWDYDLAWHNCIGNCTNTGWQYQMNDSANPSPKWWFKLMQDSNFTNKLYCRWHELRQTVLTDANLYAFVDSLGAVLNESQQRNFTQWPILGANIHPNPQIQQGASYQSELTDLKTWISARAGWLDWAIQGHCPVLTNTTNDNSMVDNIRVFPNPMSTSTTIALTLKQNADVSLRIVDVVGNEVALLLNEHAPSGESQVLFDREQLPAGIYFYQLQVNRSLKTGKIVVQ